MGSCGPKKWLHEQCKKCVLLFSRGVSYKQGEPFPQSIVKNPCTQNCGCSTRGGVPQFTCAVVDCVETGTLEECIRTYELDSCCSTGTVCGQFSSLLTFYFTIAADIWSYDYIIINGSTNFYGHDHVIGDMDLHTVHWVYPFPYLISAILYQDSA